MSSSLGSDGLPGLLKGIAADGLDASSTSPLVCSRAPRRGEILLTSGCKQAEAGLRATSSTQGGNSTCSTWGCGLRCWYWGPASCLDGYWGKPSPAGAPHQEQAGGILKLHTASKYNYLNSGLPHRECTQLPAGTRNNNWNQGT